MHKLALKFTEINYTTVQLALTNLIVISYGAETF